MSKIEIHVGDNCEKLMSMEGEFADLVVTSPPYDNLREYGGHSWDFYLLASLLYRAMKPGAVMAWVVKDKIEKGNITGSCFLQVQHFQRIGFQHWDTMIWDKQWSNYGDTSKRYANFWEYIFVLSKGDPKTINIIRDRPNVSAGNKMSSRSDRRVTGDKNGTARSDNYTVHEMGPRKGIWEVAVGKGSPIVNGVSHPAVFPGRLAGDLIKTWTDEGDMVLDPFVGSGTVANQSRNLGRNCLGIEINPDYAAIANSVLDQQLLPFSSDS